MSSAQSLVRLGGPLDVYYQDKENAKKQTIPTVVDQRYTQAFSNLSQGTSVFTIPPNSGVSHVLAVMNYSAAAISAVSSSFALNRSWCYEAIQQVSFRVGGSSQYFLTGAQLLARNLRMARTQSQRDAILQLGGAVTIGGTTVSPANGYVPISIWAMPGDDGLNLPLPSDCLSQQIQVTITLNPAYVSAGAGDGSLSTIPNMGFWHLATGSVLSGITSANSPPASLTNAYFQVQQIQMKDRSMALSNHVDLDREMYSMALPTFDQFEQTFPLAAAVDGSQPQSVTLTGFRAGEVKEIQFWLSKNYAGTGTADDMANPNLWYAPSLLQVLYAGLVYSNYQNGSSQMWNLLNGTSPSAVNQNVLTSAGGVWTLSANPQLSQWTEAPFSQPTGSDYEASVLVHGLEITNGIVNVLVTPPAISGVSAGTQNAWTLHVAYVYNATLGFSRGTADLIF
jgi:hypothetical protein